MSRKQIVHSVLVYLVAENTMNEADMTSLHRILLYDVIFIKCIKLSTLIIVSLFKDCISMFEYLYIQTYILPIS